MTRGCGNCQDVSPLTTCVTSLKRSAGNYGQFKIAEKKTDGMEIAVFTEIWGQLYSSQLKRRFCATGRYTMTSRWLQICLRENSISTCVVPTQRYSSAEFCVSCVVCRNMLLDTYSSRRWFGKPYHSSDTIHCKNNCWLRGTDDITRRPLMVSSPPPLPVCFWWHELSTQQLRITFETYATCHMFQLNERVLSNIINI